VKTTDEVTIEIWKWVLTIGPAIAALYGLVVLGKIVVRFLVGAP